MKEVAAMVRNHLEGIVAWAQTRQTNAISFWQLCRITPKSAEGLPDRLWPSADGHEFQAARWHAFPRRAHPGRRRGHRRRLRSPPGDPATPHLHAAPASRRCAA